LTDVFGTADSPSVLIRETGTVAVVSGLSLLVLLGGCATVAALVFTHYERRRFELALKASLGASRARLVRDLSIELLAVALVGSAGALVFGLLGARAAPSLSLPGGVNVARLDLSLDWRLCAASLAATCMTLAVASIVPLWQVTRGRLAGEILTGPSTITVGTLRTRRRLLALQVCSTTIVLLASGLFIRTVLYSFRTGAGFDLDHTVFVTVQERPLVTAPGGGRAATGFARRTQLNELLERLPSVQDVAGGASPIGVDARPLPRTIKTAEREERLVVGILNGTPNLLSTLGVPLLGGRALAPGDGIESVPMPVVVTRSLSERLWTQNDPLGQRLSLPEMRPGNYVVVGIAENFAFGTLTRPVSGVIVTARGDFDFRATSIVLRTAAPGQIVNALPSELPDRVVRVATGRDIVGADIAQQRLGAWAFSGFGLVSLLLGVGGVFGLVGYLAQTRRREFGVRLALGATVLDVIRTAMTAALGPVLVGVLVGLLFGAIASRVFAAFLVGIGRQDTATYVSVGLTMLASAMVAALAAAWRLRQLTPSDALRRS